MHARFSKCLTHPALSSILLLGILTGCSSTLLQVPIHRFSTPEVGGDSTWEVDFTAIRRDDTMEFTAGTDNARTISPNYNQKTDPVAGKSNDLPGVDAPTSIAMSFTERFEAQVAFSFFFTPQELELKYQLLGETRATTGPGNFSLALSALVGAGPLNFGLHTSDDTNPVDWQLDETILSEGVIAGYRVTQGVLFYTGVFANQAWVSVTRTEPNAPGLGAVKSRYTGKATSTTFNLGVELMPWVSKENQGAFVRAELASSAFQMAGIANVNSGVLFGAQVGIRY